MDEFNFTEVWNRVGLLTGWKNQSQLADFLGFSSASITGAKGRGFFPIEWAYKIARGYDSSTDWLLTGEGPMHIGKWSASQQSLTASEESGDAAQIPATGTFDPDMFHPVPMTETKLSAGGGAFVISEEVTGYYAFRKDWLRRMASSEKNVVLMQVMGNSMAPTIQDKDTVLIDTGRLEVIEGMIYAIRMDHTIMIKRLTHRPGGIINVISDNKEEYESYQANRSDIHVIGQIIFFSRDLISGY